MLNLADPFVLHYYWRQWDGRQLRLILPTALVGIVLGVWMISGMPDHRLRKVIGAVALVLAVLQLVFMREDPRGTSLGRGQRHRRADRHRLGRGQFGRHHHAGPYLAGLGLSNATVVATGAGALVAANCLKVVSYWTIGFLTWRMVGLSPLPHRFSISARGSAGGSTPTFRAGGLPSPSSPSRSRDPSSSCSPETSRPRADPRRWSRGRRTDAWPRHEARRAPSRASCG